MSSAVFLFLVGTTSALQPLGLPRSQFGSPTSTRSLVQRTVSPIAAAGGPVVPSPDYKLAASCLVLGPTILVAPWLLGGFFTLLGILFVVQTLRIRFVFDDDSFEVHRPSPLTCR